MYGGLQKFEIYAMVSIVRTFPYPTLTRQIRFGGVLIMTVWINVLALGFLPLLIGVALRLAMNRTDRPYLITFVCAGAAVIFWLLASFIDIQGSELLGVISMEVIYLALGTLVGGVLARVRRHI